MSDRPTIDEAYEAHGVLHELWTRSKDQPGYDKKKWLVLDNALSALLGDRFGGGWIARYHRDREQSAAAHPVCDCSDIPGDIWSMTACASAVDSACPIGKHCARHCKMFCK